MKEGKKKLVIYGRKQILALEQPQKEVCCISVFLWKFGYNMTALHYHSGKESHRMNWVYYGKLYTSKFQAGCFAKRLEQDGWLFGYHDPRMVEVYRSKKGRYGVRFMP